MQKRTFEVAVPVSDLLSETKGDVEEAFEIAAKKPGPAVELAGAEATAALGERAGLVQIGDATFQEFDSPNVSHACAYWEIEFMSEDAELLHELWAYLSNYEEAETLPSP